MVSGQNQAQDISDLVGLHVAVASQGKLMNNPFLPADYAYQTEID